VHIVCNEVVLGCRFTASADTEEELTDKVATTHAAQDHGVPEVTPELAAKVKAAMRVMHARAWAVRGTIP
jgi:predicted small metal-binding protein